MSPAVLLICSNSIVLF